MKHFHYIFAGAGCAGLSLLVRLLQTGKFSDKNILLIDKAPKAGNDRTWCFWEKDAGFFESVTFKSWDRLWFHSPGHSALHQIYPYQYKMIRGEDFYHHCFSIIRQYSNVSILYGQVEKMESNDQQATVMVDGKEYEADYIFNSILSGKPELKKNQYYLLQHFKGWIIETSKHAFDPSAATLMDFRVSQHHGTTFVYVMPFSTTQALVEYTLFTDRLLEQAEYDEGLKDYITRFLNIQHYEIAEQEFGVIPMTNYLYPSSNGCIINIGTAGGQTKASSGYTFRFIQKQAEQITKSMLATGRPNSGGKRSGKRFRLYDSTLLRILSREKLSGSTVFTTLFKKNKTIDILQFLDNESSILQEMKIVNGLPKRIFLQAAFKQLMS